MAGKIAYVQRVGSALLPVGEAHEETVRSIPQGKTVEARFLQRRNADHHSRIWAEFTGIAAIFRAHGREHYDAEAVKRLAMILTNQCEVMPLPPTLAKVYGTKIAAYPNSLSYAAKDEAQISTFHDQWRQGFMEHIYPHFDAATQREVDRIFYGRFK